jgi:hypothetical protein
MHIFVCRQKNCNNPAEKLGAMIQNLVNQDSEICATLLCTSFICFLRSVEMLVVVLRGAFGAHLAHCELPAVTRHISLQAVACGFIQTV